MTDGMQSSAGQHWPIGVALLMLALAVSVRTVRPRHLQMTVLLGLLAATALAGMGAGLVSTGTLTIHGWGPFLVAAVLVLGPLVLSRVLRTRTPHRTGNAPTSTRAPHHRKYSSTAREEAGRGVSH